MAVNYDSIDLRFSSEGDFSIDALGDVRDTSDDLLRSIRQELETRVRSSLRDWLSDPWLGADLTDFIGEPNTRELANDIALQIRHALVFDGLVASSDLEVIPMPLDVHVIVFRLVLKVSTLEDTGSVTIDVAYDTLQDGPTIL